MAALSIESIAFAKSQPCVCFRFVFFRFIMFWYGADFPLVSSPFFAFLPTEAKQRENDVIGGTHHNVPNWGQIESPLLTET